MILIPLIFRYHFTGRFWDTLRDLAEVGSFPESHASLSVNNNKRVYGSDEPAESPPDNNSKVPPTSRGPFASSKRVSSSLGPSPGDVASVVDDMAASSPASITPDIQKVGGDLNILSVTDSISTPEKTDGPETSGCPSLGTLTRIFDGDAMPITTNDLGRLPIHHGVKLSTDLNFGEIASGWNTTGSEQSPDLNTRGTQTGVIPGLHPPQEPDPGDPFPWMLCTTMMGAGEAPKDSVQTQQTADRLDCMISSLFGDVPSTSFTTLGQVVDLSPGPVSGGTGHHTDIFDALFPPSDPPVETHPSTTVQTAQHPHEIHEEQEYGSLPVNAQAYLRGWSNAPQAFEYVMPSFPLLRNVGIQVDLSTCL